MNKENKKFNRPMENINYWMNVRKRMEFARDNGTNTLMLTSTGEPLENMDAIIDVLDMNRKLNSPFKWIELQTSGVGLLEAIEKYDTWFDYFSTISISVVDIFDSINNASLMNMPAERSVPIAYTIYKLKELGFNVRLSINLTELYNGVHVAKIFRKLVELEIDQVTFRKLYKSGGETKQDKWIDEHAVYPEVLDAIVDYVETKGNKLERLPFGAMKYSVEGISTVVDDDCMAKETKNILKYMIIREDGKLYTKWDDKGSLIF
jgi:hypothetical protein